jgi:hypothetical protein
MQLQTHTIQKKIKDKKKDKYNQRPFFKSVYNHGLNNIHNMYFIQVTKKVLTTDVKKKTWTVYVQCLSFTLAVYVIYTAYKEGLITDTKI